MNALDVTGPALLQKIAQMVHAGVNQDYPNQPGHIVMSMSDARSPRELHPAFYGCFDWHSAVHSHWTLLKLLERDIHLPDRMAMHETMESHLSRQALLGEMAYFLESGRAAFERPYGWAWIWKLTADLAISPLPDAAAWYANIRPLAEMLAERFVQWLSRQVYPCRAGTHGNTAFALQFGLLYARTCDRPEFEVALKSAAMQFYGRDRQLQFRTEPSGNDFLSPLLAEIDLMGDVLAPEAWRGWLDSLLIDGAESCALQPLVVTDRDDGQGVHLDGVNLSRAWHLASIAEHLRQGAANRVEVHAALAQSARLHWEAGIRHLFSGNFLGEHWLGTYAILAGAGLQSKPLGSCYAA